MPPLRENPYSDENVERYIKLFDKKIIELRSKYPKHGMLPRLMKFSKNTVASWVEKKIEHNTGPIYNETVLNSILDRINEMDYILKNKSLSENIISRNQLGKIIREIIKEYLTEGKYIQKGTANGIVNRPIGKTTIYGRPLHTPFRLDITTPKLGHRIKTSSTLYKRGYFSGKQLKIPAGSIGIIKDIRGKFNRWMKPKRRQYTTDPTTKKYVPSPIPADSVRYVVYFDKYGYVSMDYNEFKVVK